MSKYKIKLNKDGVRQLLKSEAMMSECKEHAKAIKNRAGNGYATSNFKGKTRVNVSVYTQTKKAKKDCKDNNTLLKALR